MTENEKQLLLKDLCGRLPYGVMCRLSAKGADISITEKLEFGGLEHFIYGTMDVKPYLRPISSMTKEEQQKYYDLTHQEEDDVWAKCLFDKMTDFCNERHLDYRGLIEKGLALEAPKDMYKTE